MKSTSLNFVLKVSVNFKCWVSPFGAQLPNPSLSQGWQMGSLVLWPHFILRGYKQPQIDKWDPAGESKKALKLPFSLLPMHHTSWEIDLSVNICCSDTGGEERGTSSSGTVGVWKVWPCYDHAKKLWVLTKLPTTTQRQTARTSQ